KKKRCTLSFMINIILIFCLPYSLSLVDTINFREGSTNSCICFSSVEKPRSFSSLAHISTKKRPLIGELHELLDQGLKRHVATRLPFIDAFLLKMKKEKVLLANKKIWSYRSVIIPEFVGYTVRIYNGRTFVHYTRSRSLFRVSTTTGKKKGKK
ncbi:hypothetical protein P3X46_034635, partial [Hevea brasiliensis]